MARGDGTGPMGAGAMTGRGLGSCVGSRGNVVGGRGVGRGMWMVGGRGMGVRNRNFSNVVQQAPEVSAEQEKEFIQNDVKALENELEAAKQRLNELSK
jgi:hypothetical protein